MQPLDPRQIQGIAPMLKHFGPQIALNPQTRPLCTSDRAFCAFAAIHFEWPKLVGTANTLALLTDARYLALLTQALESATPITHEVQGVSGDVLFTKETPQSDDITMLALRSWNS